MILPFTWPWSMFGGGGSASTTPVEFEFTPTEGEQLQIPQTEALIINVLLWPATILTAVGLRFPEGLVAGRRVFIYVADNSIAQLTVTAEAGVTVANGVAAMNENDEIVFNTVSTTQQIIARVAS